MIDTIQFTVDKFTFSIATDRLYTSEGLWVKPEPEGVRIGLSDYLQQRSGDIAFVEVQPAGSELTAGEEIVVIETIKVNIGLGSPASGKILQVNPILEEAPEMINQEPYQSGWIATMEAAQWEEDKPNLLDAQSYLAKARTEAESEA